MRLSRIVLITVILLILIPTLFHTYVLIDFSKKLRIHGRQDKRSINQHHSSEEDDDDDDDGTTALLFYASNHQKNNNILDNNNEYNAYTYDIVKNKILHYFKSITNNNIIDNDATQSVTITIDWNTQGVLHQVSNVTNKVDLPIIVVGLPKAGTTSIEHFFKQANNNYTTSHWDCPKSIFSTRPKKRKRVLCGPCIHHAIQQGLPPLKSCGNYDVFAQIDASQIPNCHIPQIAYLQQIYDEFPTATWILNTRNTTKWYNSVYKWAHKDDLSLAPRLVECSNVSNYPGEFPTSTNQTEMVQWFLDHSHRIRTFVKKHPSLSFLEVDIENPNTATIMGDFFGFNASQWEQQNTGDANQVAQSNFILRKKKRQQRLDRLKKKKTVTTTTKIV